MKALVLTGKERVEMQDVPAPRPAAGWRLGAIPDWVSDEGAVWSEPLANIVHCFRISMSETPKSMAILGAGTMGALGLTVAKSRKIEKVVAVDKNEARLKAAKEIGADVVINVDDSIHGRGARA